MSTEYISILTLAYSLKKGGYCFAGKKVAFEDDSFEIYDWCRPVSGSIKSSGPILSQHILGTDNLDTNKKTVEPQLFEIWDVPILYSKEDYLKECDFAYGRPNSKEIQNENILIDESKKWIKLKNAFHVRMKLHEMQLWAEHVENEYGRTKLPGTSFEREDYLHILDEPENLWADNSDRVDPSMIDKSINNSIFCIKPYFRDGTPKIEVEDSKITLEFLYKNQTYKLKITDPIAKGLWAKYKVDDPESAKSKFCEYIKDSYLTISLGDYWHGHHYKLIAAILKPKKP